MTTKNQEKKTKTAKTPAKKARVSKAKSKSSESIGFLRAAHNMHVAVGEIPLTFFAEIGIAKDKMESAKDLNRKFVGGMYERLEGFTSKIDEIVSAPAKLAGILADKLQEATATKKAVVKPKAAAPKAKARPKAKAATPKAKARPKAKAAAPKAKAKPKPKAATPKAKAKPKTESAKPAAVAVSAPSKLNTGVQLRSV